jgi:shikimate dehydrogenase
MSDKYAVIGNPVEHSFSPAIHAAFAAATGQDISYGKILAPLDGFGAAILKFRDGGGSGLNVTLPFKHEAWNLSEAQGMAIDANAVNTLKFERGRILGYNTDGIGLVRDLKDNLRLVLEDQRVLVMGAGGATYGVVEPLLRERAQVTIVNRTLDKAQQLVRHFQAITGIATRSIAWQSYDRLHDDRFDIVINATSAGLTDDMPPLPEGIFAGDALAYDMVYGKSTPFLEFAAAREARTADGLGMLVEQAAESFYIWRGVRPDTAPVIRALRMKAEG